MDLFRRSEKVSPHEVDALLGLRPLRDDVFLYLLDRALSGTLEVYFAAIPPSLIRPFDTQYNPSKHPVGAAAIEQITAEWQAGIFPRVWVYPSGDRYVLSDDYIPWAAAERGQPDYLACWVLGYPSIAGAVDIQGPIAADSLRELLGFAAGEVTDPVITRDQARAIAEATIHERGLGIGIRAVVSLEEITCRLPVLYAGPDLAECWIAYVDRKLTGLMPSTIVLISKKTGEVLYAGGANDEG